MISIDGFLGRVYEPGYKCLHFASDVWHYLTGVDIRSRLLGGHIASFRREERPVDPCIVLMQSRGVIPHVGVYYRGRVLHLTELGVQYQPVEIATLGFKTIRFYSC